MLTRLTVYTIGIDAKAIRMFRPSQEKVHTSFMIFLRTHSVREGDQTSTHEPQLPVSAEEAKALFKPQSFIFEDSTLVSERVEKKLERAWSEVRKREIPWLKSEASSTPSRMASSLRTPAAVSPSTQAIMTTQATHRSTTRSRTFIAAALFFVTAASILCIVSIGSINSSSDIVRNIGSNTAASPAAMAPDTSAAAALSSQKRRQMQLINRAQRFTRRIFSQEVVRYVTEQKHVPITSWELSAKPSSTRSFFEKESTFCIFLYHVHHFDVCTILVHICPHRFP